MVDIVNILENMHIADNVNMVDSKYRVNMQKTFGFLKLLVDTLGWTRYTLKAWWT